MPTTKICAHCHTPFHPKRRDAKYCSPRCRHEAFRQRQEAPRGLTLYNDPWVEEVEAEEVEPFETVHPSGHVSAYDLYRREQMANENQRRSRNQHSSYCDSSTRDLDLYDEHSVNPQRYPRHYYTYFGKLTPAGWRGIDPMDRESLLRKRCDEFSDYEWLEEDIWLNGRQIDIYEGIKQEMFGKREPEPEMEKVDPYADWSKREAKAVRKYIEEMSECMYEIQDWVGSGEEGVDIERFANLIDSLNTYLESKSYDRLPEDCPMGDWLEERVQHMEAIYEELDEDFETLRLAFSEDWLDDLDEIEELMYEYDI